MQRLSVAVSPLVVIAKITAGVSSAAEIRRGVVDGPLDENSNRPPNNHLGKTKPIYAGGIAFAHS